MFKGGVRMRREGERMTMRRKKREKGKRVGKAQRRIDGGGIIKVWRPPAFVFN